MRSTPPHGSAPKVLWDLPLTPGFLLWCLGVVEGVEVKLPEGSRGPLQFPL